MADRCRNGHDLTGEDARVWTGDHSQCAACRRRSQSEAQSRYQSTVKGILTTLRYQSAGHLAQAESIGLDVAALVADIELDPMVEQALSDMSQSIRDRMFSEGAR